MNFLKKCNQKFSNKYKLHENKAASYWLAILAFLESSVFLLPVDVLYIPLLLRKPHKAYKYALIATIFSVLGGILGWTIGAFAYKTIALPILAFYGKQEALAKIQTYHSLKLIILMLLTSGLVHLPPIKLVNIFAGLMHINIFIFILLNVISRTIRLYGLAWLISKYGEQFIYKSKNFFKILFTKEKYKQILFLTMFFISFAVFLSSFFLQYVWGFLPCKLCLIERDLFLAISLLCLITYLYRAKYSVYFILVLIISNMFLSFYHYGVERKFWKGPSSCSSTHLLAPQTSADLLRDLQQSHIIPCDIVGGHFLNISLTAWSLVSCIILLMFSIILLYALHKNHDK